MKAYWAKGSGAGNFGDVLTPILFERLLGIRLQWVERENAELFGIGSIAELIPPHFSGYVIGTGCMFNEPIELNGARVLALRGAHTARLAGLHPPFLADLGLLALDLLRRRPVRDIPVGTVRAGGDPRPSIGLALDPGGDPDEMIQMAARCQRIVSSSLHGLILADSLGIPSMWDPWPVDVTFKFRDYASAYGERLEPYQWRVADQRQVAAKQESLRLALATVAAGVPV